MRGRLRSGASVLIAERKISMVFFKMVVKYVFLGLGLMKIRSARRSWISAKKITPGYWYCRSMMKIFPGYPCTGVATIRPFT